MFNHKGIGFTARDLWEDYPRLDGPQVINAVGRERYLLEDNIKDNIETTSEVVINSDGSITISKRIIDLGKIMSKVNIDVNFNDIEIEYILNETEEL